MSSKAQSNAKTTATPAPASAIFQVRPFAAEQTQEHAAPNHANAALPGHRFAAIDCQPRTPLPLIVQPKLRLGPANDQYEQQADRIAAQVVGGRNTPSTQAGLRQPLVQRVASAPSAGIAVTPGVEAGIHAARGSGQPLPAAVRSQMETAIGADFSSVRVHNDSRAHALNQAVQARAFTTGRDVFFGRGEYQPGSNEGRRVLAHELAHVVQQGLFLTTPNELTQQNESAVAQRMMRGGTYKNPYGEDKGISKDNEEVEKKYGSEEAAEWLEVYQEVEKKYGSEEAAQWLEVYKHEVPLLERRILNANQQVHPTNLEASRNGLGDTVDTVFSSDDTVTNLFDEALAVQAATDKFQQLAPTQLAQMPPYAFAALDPTNCIAYLSQAQAQAITPMQAQAMKNTQFRQLAPARLADLQNLTFAALDSQNCIAQLSQAQAQAITDQQVSSMNHSLLSVIPSNVFLFIPVTNICTTLAMKRHLQCAEPDSLRLRLIWDSRIRADYQCGQTTIGSQGNQYWINIDWGLPNYGLHVHFNPSGNGFAVARQQHKVRKQNNTVVPICDQPIIETEISASVMGLLNSIIDRVKKGLQANNRNPIS